MEQWCVNRETDARKVEHMSTGIHMRKETYPAMALQNIHDLMAYHIHSPSRWAGFVEKYPNKARMGAWALDSFKPTVKTAIVEKNREPGEGGGGQPGGDGDGDSSLPPSVSQQGEDLPPLPPPTGGAPGGNYVWEEETTDDQELVPENGGGGVVLESLQSPLGLRLSQVRREEIVRALSELMKSGKGPVTCITYEQRREQESQMVLSGAYSEGLKKPPSWFHGFGGQQGEGPNRHIPPSYAIIAQKEKRSTGVPVRQNLPSSKSNELTTRQQYQRRQSKQ